MVIAIFGLGEEMTGAALEYYCSNVTLIVKLTGASVQRDQHNAAAARRCDPQGWMEL
jgi:hypothetical protein